MKSLKDKVAVVTGAGSGIGRALAQQLARERANLAVADVNEAGLDETVRLVAGQGVKVSKHLVDVSKEDAVERFAQEVRREHGTAHLLINNAGVAMHGLFEEYSNDELRWLMDINFWGVVYGVRAFLPLLLEAPEAHIVNLSSLFGIVAPAGQTAYSASKFAVRGFSEALRHELAGSRIGLTVVHPGGIKTNIATTARAPQGFDENEAKKRAELFNKIAARMPSEKAADIILRAVKSKKGRVLVGGDAVIVDTIVRNLPEKYWGVLGKVMDPKGWYRSKRARA